MKAHRAIVLAVTVLAASVAQSGHEAPVYPSYYPHEIEISTIAPEVAGDLLARGRLHAYLGETGFLVPTPPPDVSAVVSLGSLLVVRLNPASPRVSDDASACPLMRTIIREMAARAKDGDFTVHPYPVTPWHGDYIYHADRAEAARGRLLRDEAAAVADIKVRADGDRRGRFVRSEWLTDGPQWDAAIEEVSVAGLVAQAATSTNAWLGPRFVRSGWFHAALVLGGSPRDTDRQDIEARIARLKSAEYEGIAERINLERELVQLLAASCRMMIAGYTSKHQLFNSQFSAGIENIAFDALEGLRSPMFLRTVKLKDFPWNGSLLLGSETPPGAAWNPVAGFTDPVGRLAWTAIGDPAAIPSPYEANWTLNRISEVETWPRK
jgi:hypothetical protein